MDLTSEDLAEIYEFAKDLGRAAGQLLLDGVERRRQSTSDSDTAVEKDNSVDLVTQTDEDVEAFIQGRIEHAYPSHAFIGEETYAKNSSKTKRCLIQDDTPTWCVDPLDGTVNYIHLFPMYCVSIALVYRGQPVIGVICAPFTNQLFHSCTGHGAWLTTTNLDGTLRHLQLPLLRSPIPPLPGNAPKGCIFSFEWGKDRRDSLNSNMHRKAESFINMAAEVGGRDGKGGMVHGMRSLGSATLDLAYTAMGSFDIWWEGGCWEWDVAAGIAILKEAGGLITTANPPEEYATAQVDDVKLGSRLYLAIRPAGNKPEESARQQQERVVREVWKRVRILDYARPD